MTTSPQTFRKKPVEIEAMHFEGGAENAIPIIDWVLDNGGTARWSEAREAWEDEGGKKGYPAQPEAISVDTLEGTMRADVGDWIIREPFPTDDRKFYPCKPDIFAATYDACGEPGPSTRVVNVHIPLNMQSAPSAQEIAGEFDRHISQR